MYLKLFIFVVTYLVRRVRGELESSYVTTKDFSLTLDLMEIFNGNNIQFEIQSVPNATKQEIESKIRFNSSVDLSEGGIYSGFALKGVKVHFPYILGIYVNQSSDTFGDKVLPLRTTLRENNDADHRNNEEHHLLEEKKQFKKSDYGVKVDTNTIILAQIFTYKYNSTKGVEKFELFQKKNITYKEEDEKGKPELNIFSVELISSENRFFIDGRFIYYNQAKENMEEVVKVEDVLFTGTLERLENTQTHNSDLIKFIEDVTDIPWSFTKDTFDDDNNPLTYLRRSLIQKSISAFGDKLFRSTSVRTQNKAIKTTALIQYLDLSKLDFSIVPSSNQTIPIKKMKYATVQEYENQQDINNIIIYSFDMFIGMTNRIERRTLDPKTMKFTKTKVSYIDKSVEIILEVDDHVDIYSIGEDQEIDLIRWDEFVNPIVLLPIKFDNEIKVTGALSSYQFTVFLLNDAKKKSDRIIIRRLGELQIYDTIEVESLKEPTKSQYSRFMSISPDNYLLYTTYSGTETEYKPNLHVLSYRRTQVAVFQAEENTKVTLIAKPDGDESQKEEKSFQIQVVNDNTKIYNAAKVQDETEYLNESLSSEYIFIRSIPQKWFIGNEIQFSSTCTVQNTREKIKLPINQIAHKRELQSNGDDKITPFILSDEKLNPKQFNLITKGKSANNVFYYEVYSQPNTDGSYSQMMQIEQSIYFNKCLVSLQNKLKCRTWLKVDEQEMILSARLVKDKYFIYKTQSGIKVLQMDPENKKLIKTFEGFLEGRSTFTYQVMQRQDFLFCSDFENRRLHVYSLGENFSEFLVLEDIYANQIDISPLYSTLVFLGSEKVIYILSIRTKSIINTIGDGDHKSEVISQRDSSFKICRHHLLAITLAGNKVEEYDIRDPYNVIRIKEPLDIGEYGGRNFRLSSNTKIGFHFGCRDILPLLVSDGEKVKTMIIRLGTIKPNSIR